MTLHDTLARARARFVLPLIAIAMLTPFLTVTPAAAADPCSGPFCVGGDTTPAPTPNPNPSGPPGSGTPGTPGNGGNGGGGDCLTNPALNICATTTSYTITRYFASNGAVGSAYSTAREPNTIYSARGGAYPSQSGYLTPSTRDVNGRICSGRYTYPGTSYSVPYRGYRVAVTVTGQADASLAWITVTDYRWSNYRCILPPAAQVENVVCYREFSAQLRGVTPAFDPPAGTSGSRLAWRRALAPRPTPYSRLGTYQSCLRPGSYNFSDTPLAWGQYQLDLYAVYDRMQVLVFDNPNIDPITLGFTVRYAEATPSSHPSAYNLTWRAAMHVWCSGSGGSNYAFGTPYRPAGLTYTAADCQATNNQPGTWRCVVSNTKTWNGNAVPAGRQVEAPADGLWRTAAWTLPRIQPVGSTSNVRSVTNQTTRFNVDDESSPWLKSATRASDPDQPFKGNPTLGRSQTGWDRDVALRFLEASRVEAGKNFRVNPSWSFDAQFRTRLLIITGWDLQTGSVTTTTQSTYVTAAGTCNGPVLPIKVLRAANVPGGIATR
jgi:hypothetical protein